MMKIRRAIGPCVCGVVALGWSAAAEARTYNISSTAMTDADDGVCTLREALRAANDLVNVNCGGTGCDCLAGSGNDRINLPSGTLASPIELEIKHTVAIYGAGLNSTRVTAAYNNTNPAPDSLFEVLGDQGGTLELHDLTVRNDTNPGPLISGIYAHNNAQVFGDKRCPAARARSRGARLLHLDCNSGSSCPGFTLVCGSPNENPPP